MIPAIPHTYTMGMLTTVEMTAPMMIIFARSPIRRVPCSRAPWPALTAAKNRMIASTPTLPA